MVQKKEGSQFRVLLTLGAIWLVGALCDRLWLALDHSIPTWDPTNHLTGSLNYLNALQHAQWFSEKWWHSFWMLSSKYPPLTYIATAPFQQLFGTGPDQAVLVNLLFSAILLGSVYGLGKHLFSTEVGLWAAGLCVLLPRLYIVRINYLVDYPLTAMVAASFWCLTVWRDTTSKRQGWCWALKFGFCLGLGMMTKQTIILFLFVPLLWLLGTLLWKRTWGRLVQLISGLLLSVFIFGPWYRTNWLFFLSAQQNAVVIPALKEGDPPLNTLAAWTYYWNDLPRAVSWPLLVVPLVGLLLYWSGVFPSFRQDARRRGGERERRRGGAGGEFFNSPSQTGKKPSPTHPLTPSPAHFPNEVNATGRMAYIFRWLVLFFVGSYFFCSANMNKDLRYIMPCLPILSVVLAYGLTLWPKRLQAVRWATVGLAFLLVCLNLFPIGGIPGSYLTQALSPKAVNYPYLGRVWPHAQVIDEIIRTEPQLQATVGVLPQTADVNHNNVNYYGALQKFQVYGREVGVRKSFLDEDARSLSWFLSKTGEQAITRRKNQARMTKKVEQSPDLQLHKTWDLPDGTVLKLYHRVQPPIQVKPIQQAFSKVSLERVTVPQQAPAGVPIPVTYEWSGSWKQLRSGIVLLTWKAELKAESSNLQPSTLQLSTFNPSTLQPSTSNPSNLQPSTSNPSTLQPSTFNPSNLQLSTFNPSNLQPSTFNPSTLQPSNLQTFNLQPSTFKPSNLQRWLHDHGIAMGELHGGRLSDRQSQGSFQVIEHMAMLPPADIAAGTYTLEATYLNRETGENYPIAVPPVTLSIASNSPATPAPELDLVTQMRTLACRLPKGRKALDEIFDEIGRINQYDPVQDYAVQAALALEYRLQQEPQNRDLAYALAFSKVLQKDAQGAIAALKQVVLLDSQNPYAHAYLAFLYLYELRGKDAQNALEPALTLNPNITEVQALSGAAALLQGNVFKAWNILHKLKL